MKKQQGGVTTQAAAAPAQGGTPIQQIQGGVTAPQGFLANGVHCGIRKNQAKRDLGIIYSTVPCAAAAVFTQNLVQGAPVLLTRKNLANGRAQAVIVNSGIANTCNADGMQKATQMCQLAAQALGLASEDIVVASTGVIGQPLPLQPIQAALPALVQGLMAEGSLQAAQAIMTTDTFPKQAAVQCEIGGKTVTVGGIAKGSGMIHPNMATLLSFVTTDCAIAPALLQQAVQQAAADTFNCLSVDGDTSTNDTFALLANGLAQNPVIQQQNADYNTFVQAVTAVCRRLVCMLARDGEGATKLLLCRAMGAPTKQAARAISKAVVCSALVKTMIFGADANWGRVLCAIGYAGQAVDVSKIELAFCSEFGSITVCKGGTGVAFCEQTAAQILAAEEITVVLQLHQGSECAEAFGCDLTYDYVKINGDYRS